MTKYKRNFHWLKVEYTQELKDELMKAHGLDIETVLEKVCLDEAGQRLPKESYNKIRGNLK